MAGQHSDPPSGKFVIRMPVAMHAALRHEAIREKVSLNQLCMVKLAVQLAIPVDVNRGH